jgi:hypothetical protein
MRRINLERRDDRTQKWLFLLSFDLDVCDELDLEHIIERLLLMSAHDSKTARLIMPGDHIGILYWTPSEGWHEPQTADDPFDQVEA